MTIIPSGSAQSRIMSVPKSVTSTGLADWQIRRVLALIEVKLEAPLRTMQLAASAQLSVAHFCRAFKRSLGQPPHAYIVRRRIERAKRLMLADEPASLAQIALDCGLSYQAHLSRIFRKFMGEPPGAWRRKYRSGVPSGIWTKPLSTRGEPSWTVSGH